MSANLMDQFAQNLAEMLAEAPSDDLSETEQAESEHPEASTEGGTTASGTTASEATAPSGGPRKN